MIERMKFINIVGGLKHFDRVIEQYITRYDIQPESALNEMASVKGMNPFVYVNPYEELIKRMRLLLDEHEIEINYTNDIEDINAETSVDALNKMCDVLNDIYSRHKSRLKEREKLIDVQHQLRPLLELEFDVNKMLHFEFIKFRFGRIPKDCYSRLDTYLSDKIEAVFVPGHVDSEYVWGIYFMPEPLRDKLDAVFASLHFERMWIEDGITGTPAQAYHETQTQIETLDLEAAALISQAKQYCIENEAILTKAYGKLKFLHEAYNIRSYAAHTSDMFYLVGWMQEKDLEKLAIELQDDDDITYVVEDQATVLSSKPPTKLRNHALLRPFEFFVRMYGLPSYTELDPTPFVGITYALMFGIMFGDWGQGLVLLALGAWMYKVKKMKLGAVICLTSLSSILFGILYGSVFGFETHELWLKPLEGDNMNTLLITTIALGAVLIVTAMVINILNAVKARDAARLFMGTSGFAGMIFYVTALAAALMAITGKAYVPMIVISGILVLMLLIMLFKEPIAHALKKRREIFPGGPGNYILESFFEMFEVFISYVTNTISFIRVGAFAISHAGMMSVVHVMAEQAGMGGGIIAIIIGNVIVIALEGLIVGIQVLRLEFYEMFSRFFSGEGREFTPISINPKK